MTHLPVPQACIARIGLEIVKKFIVGNVRTIVAFEFLLGGVVAGGVVVAISRRFVLASDVKVGEQTCNLSIAIVFNILHCRWALFRSGVSIRRADFVVNVAEYATNPFRVKMSLVVVL